MGAMGSCLCQPKPSIFLSLSQIPDEFDNGEEMSMDPGVP
jgi:hypothetical protein